MNRAGDDGRNDERLPLEDRTGLEKGGDGPGGRSGDEPGSDLCSILGIGSSKGGLGRWLRADDD